MKRSLLISLALVCACAASAMADVNGSVELGGQVTGVTGNPSKFNEYRDLGNGVTGAFNLNLSHEAYYLDAFGKDFGMNLDTNKRFRDQSFGLQFGNYENLKLSLFYKEIPHNHTFGARTFFTGIGTSTLTSPIAPNAPVATALAAYNRTFDYTRDRTNKGAELEISAKTPFFFSVRAETIEVKGTLPTGAEGAVSSTAVSNKGTLKEFPAPVDYLTQTALLEAGYRSNAVTASVDGTISSFTNANQTMTLNYPIAAQKYTLYLPPENKYYKVGGSVRYRLPFLNSVLMARGSHSEMENTITLPEQTAAVKNFGGKITYTTASASVTSTPVTNLDTRVFLNYLDKQNKSTEDFAYSVTYPTSTNTANTERFGYHKINAGLDGSYKLGKTKVSAGYEYLNLDRAIRTDAVSTTDHILFAQVKNDSFDWMSAKARYERTMRKSDNQDPSLFGTTAATSADHILAFWRPIDAADKTQDAVKIGIDLEPMHGLSIGAEYIYKHNSYDKTILGMLWDTRHEVFVDATYSIGIARFNPFFEVEFVDNFSAHRRFTNNSDPFTGVTDVNNYNWTSKRNDYNYVVGIRADVDVIKDRMTVGAGYRYESVDGTEDFTSTFNPALLVPPLDKNNQVDNQRKQIITAKLDYNFTKNLKLGLSYLYEKLEYADDHFSNYVLVPTSGTNLTGAYANPSFEAHVGFMKLAYIF